MKIEEIYPVEYLEEVYLSKMCIYCKKKCKKCTLVIKYSYERYKGRDVPTVVYKCDKYIRS